MDFLRASIGMLAGVDGALANVHLHLLLTPEGHHRWSSHGPMDGLVSQRIEQPLSAAKPTFAAPNRNTGGPAMQSLEEIAGDL
jgi:hypothetical protein